VRAILGPLVAIIVGIFMFVLDGTAVNAGLAQHMHAALIAGASAKAYGDTFVVMVGGAAVAAVLGLLLRSKAAAQRAQTAAESRPVGAEAVPSASMSLG
jgi:hypothetical protein